MHKGVTEICRTLFDRGQKLLISRSTRASNKKIILRDKAHARYSVDINIIPFDMIR